MEKLKHIVVGLDGNFSGHFTDKTTHLIANTVDTDKAAAAIELGIPLVYPEWLNQCRKQNWTQAEALLECKSYLLPPLAGLCFLVENKDDFSWIIQNGGKITQIPGKQTHSLVQGHQNVVDIDWIKQKISKNKPSTEYFDGLYICLGSGFGKDLVQFLRKLIRLGGGCFMQKYGSLTTHFIISGDEPSASDLQAIDLDREVPIVKMKWLNECNKYGQRIPIDDFKVDPRSGRDVDSRLKPEKILKPVRSTSGIYPVFHNMKMNVKYFSVKEKAVICRNIEQHGGLVEDSDDSLLILPFHKVGQDGATEFWIEKCITLLDKTSLVLFQPCKFNLPMKGFDKMVVGITGYEEKDRAWIARIVKLLGGQFTECFSKDNTVLIAEKGVQSLKVSKADEWGVPVTTHEWLYQSIEAGAILPLASSKKPDVDDSFELALRKGVKEQLSLSQSSRSAPSTSSKRSFSHKSISRIENSQPFAQCESSPRQLSDAEDVSTECFSKTIDSSSSSTDIKTITSSNSTNFYQLNSTNSEVFRSIENIKNDMEELTNSRKRIRRCASSVINTNFNSICDESRRIVKYKDSEAEMYRNILLKGNKDNVKFNFLFSGFLPQEKTSLTEKAASLGVEIIESAIWEQNPTHLILAKPTSTEKFLAACASGIWIMKPEWISSSFDNGALLPEEEYEWFGDDPISQAPKYWRMANNPPFKGLKVAIANFKNASSFQRILISGGAVISEEQDSDIIFVETENTKGEKFVESRYIIEYISLMTKTSIKVPGHVERMSLVNK